MGKAKNYLRYVHESTFGLTAASQSGASIKFLKMRNTTDRFVAVPANENVFIWDLKTRQLINRLTYDSENASEVTTIQCHDKTGLIAIGYINGHIRIFEIETGTFKVDFIGHRSSIYCLAFDKDGSRLASGGKDCNIVLWDVFAEKGLFSLKGHKSTVTKLAFLYNSEHQRDCLVSSSVDAVSTIKIWDLQVQYCFCTLPGQANGAWSFVLIKEDTRLIIGSSSPELKVYSIEFNDEIELKHIGNILRNSTSISARVQDIVLDQDESIMICHSIDKIIELYAIRSAEEALSYAKKQKKKAARKDAKRKTIGDNEITPEPPLVNLNTLDPQAKVDCEINRKYGCFKLGSKVKALTIHKMPNKTSSKRYKLAVMTSSNTIDSYHIDLSSTEKDQEVLSSITTIEGASHRSDVRTVAISPDNTLIMSASAESVKIWRLDSRLCIATIETEYAICCTFVNAQNLGAGPDNRFAILGTKKGNIQLIDLASLEIIETIQICGDEKPVTAMSALPDRTGIVVGADDGVVRFFNFKWLTSNNPDHKGQTCLSLESDRTLSFQEGITCVNISPNSNLLAVALLDSTVRVHFMDTFKYFLTMYGHKFPVTAMDISDDNTLIATGSPDKNVKIWGLDFGDCHKSIFAHDDTITCIKFVPKTHYIFTCGRDKVIKQWDCDHFTKIQSLRGHQAEVWTMSLSSNGRYLVTGSHDKSIRLFRKTEEILIPIEEEETERELEDERNVFEKQENTVVGEVGLEVGFATKMTIDSVKSTDKLIEAIDVFENEQIKERDYKIQCEVAEKKNETKPAEPDRDPLLMTMMTTDYNRFMLETLRRIKSSELEQILITLPFDYVRKLIIILVIFLEKGWDVELMVRCAVFLLKVNFGQIAASPIMIPALSKLQSVIIQRTTHLRDDTGFNLMALDHLGKARRYQNTRISHKLPYSFY